MVAVNAHPECARRAGRHGYVSNAGGEKLDHLPELAHRRAEKIEPSTGFGIAAMRLAKQGVKYPMAILLELY